MSSRTPIRSTQAFCLSKLTRRTNETLVDGTIARENYGIALPIGSALRTGGEIRQSLPLAEIQRRSGAPCRARPSPHGRQSTVCLLERLRYVSGDPTTVRQLAAGFAGPAVVIGSGRQGGRLVTSAKCNQSFRNVE
jgi:hypothetical protein